jgi:hypothetical protein
MVPTASAFRRPRVSLRAPHEHRARLLGLCRRCLAHCYDCSDSVRRVSHLYTPSSPAIARKMRRAETPADDVTVGMLRPSRHSPLRADWSKEGGWAGLAKIRVTEAGIDTSGFWWLRRLVRVAASQANDSSERGKNPRRRESEMRCQSQTLAPSRAASVREPYTRFNNYRLRLWLRYLCVWAGLFRSVCPPFEHGLIDLRRATFQPSRLLSA